MCLQTSWTPCNCQGDAVVPMGAVNTVRHKRVSAENTTKRDIPRDSTVGAINMPRI